MALANLVNGQAKRGCAQSPKSTSEAQAVAGQPESA
jgi:hypothetical protein